MNYYLTMNIHNICRICLEKQAKLTPIFDPKKPPHFSVLIMACASVQVQENDGLPLFICQKCISRLNIAFQFKMQCETSNRKLRECFQSYNDGYSPQIPQQNEQILKEKNGITLQENVIIPETNRTEMKTENLRVSNKKRLKLYQCETCQKVFRTKPSLVHHVRIHTGERPYVCHLCQKRFVNGGHLHTHMKTHTGEKNHICSACNKAFATAQQLTKHTIAIHTSERPYGCTYCSKRFASSSNLNTHIKIHTGEKNFHCEMCGKTFSTKGQLLQHRLVHTGEKAFLCEYCHKNPSRNGTSYCRD